jgi:hypothetical protein
MLNMHTPYVHAKETLLNIMCMSSIHPQSKDKKGRKEGMRCHTWVEGR